VRNTSDRSSHHAFSGLAAICDRRIYALQNRRKRRKEFERAYVDAAKSLDASPQCLAYELSNCTEDTGFYTLRLEWNSEDGHLKGFRTRPEFKTFFAAVQPYVKDIQEMRHYQITPVTRRKP
jgi:quinol monooxygenase YgiN